MRVYKMHLRPTDGEKRLYHGISAEVWIKRFTNIHVCL